MNGVFRVTSFMFRERGLQIVKNGVTWLHGYCLDDLVIMAENVKDLRIIVFIRAEELV